MITVAISKAEMERVDWDTEFQPKPHPFKTKINGDLKTLVDIETGKEICRCNDGYVWYWNHSHLHVRREDELTDSDTNYIVNEPGQPKLDMINNLGQARELISRAIGYYREHLAVSDQAATRKETENV